MALLPKYFENLQLRISAITGEPRIVSINPKKPNMSDKYKVIGQQDWILTLLNYFSCLQHPMFHITNNWIYFVGGKAKSKEELINSLKNLIKQIEQIPDEVEENGN